MPSRPGFLAGAILGTYYGWLRPSIGVRGQLLLGAGAAALLAAAWAIALAAHG